MGVPLTPYSLRRKRKEPRMNTDGRGLKRSLGSPSLPHRILFRRFKMVVFSEECLDSRLKIQQSKIVP